MSTRRERQREENIARAMNRCQHFNGSMSKRCRAGVSYDSFPRPGLPCLRDTNCANFCNFALFPTRAEAEAAEDRAAAECRRVVAQINTARAAIVEHSGGKRGIRGSLTCPCCEGGTLSYSVSGYNGHVHAQCSTQGCVRWME